MRHEGEEGDETRHPDVGEVRHVAPGVRTSYLGAISPPANCALTTQCDDAPFSAGIFCRGVPIGRKTSRFAGRSQRRSSFQQAQFRFSRAPFHPIPSSRPTNLDTERKPLTSTARHAWKPQNTPDDPAAMAPTNPVIGLLGGGQLGRMLCEAAGPLGIEVAVLDSPSCPTKQINTSPRHVAGSFKDAERIRQLARNSDFLSVEIEHVDADTLADIKDNGVEVAEGAAKRVEVHPAPRSLALIRDKFAQKAHFEEAGIPVAAQVALGANIEEALRDAGERFGFPFMVKSRTDSYDGRGNFVVADAGAFGNVTESLGRDGLYAEKMVPFTKELAVMVIRAEDEGPERTYAYPAVETVHQDSICTTVYMPPRGVPADVCAKAQDLARKVVGTLWGRGVFAVEMFLTGDGASFSSSFPLEHC